MPSKKKKIPKKPPAKTKQKQKQTQTVNVKVHIDQSNKQRGGGGGRKAAVQQQQPRNTIISMNHPPIMMTSYHAMEPQINTHVHAGGVRAGSVAQAKNKLQSVYSSGPNSLSKSIRPFSEPSPAAAEAPPSTTHPGEKEVAPEASPPVQRESYTSSTPVQGGPFSEPPISMEGGPFSTSGGNQPIKNPLSKSVGSQLITAAALPRSKKRHDALSEDEDTPQVATKNKRKKVVIPPPKQILKDDLRMIAVINEKPQQKYILHTEPPIDFFRMRMPVKIGGNPFSEQPFMGPFSASLTAAPKNSTAAWGDGHFGVNARDIRQVHENPPPPQPQESIGQQRRPKLVARNPATRPLEKKTYGDSKRQKVYHHYGGPFLDNNNQKLYVSTGKLKNK